MPSSSRKVVPLEIVPAGKGEAVKSSTRIDPLLLRSICASDSTAICRTMLPGFRVWMAEQSRHDHAIRSLGKDYAPTVKAYYERWRDVPTATKEEYALKFVPVVDYFLNKFLSFAPDDKIVATFVYTPHTTEALTSVVGLRASWDDIKAQFSKFQKEGCPFVGESLDGGMTFVTVSAGPNGFAVRGDEVWYHLGGQWHRFDSVQNLQLFHIESSA